MKAGKTKNARRAGKPDGRSKKFPGGLPAGEFSILPPVLCVFYRLFCPEEGGLGARKE